MKALICSVNAKYVHSSLAIWYLKKSVQQHCGQSVRAEILEGSVNQPPDEILQKILEIKPDIAAFSCYIWNIRTIEGLLPKIKEQLPDTVLVLGGPEVSFCAEDILNKVRSADYIVCGEGERPFALLLACLHAGKNPGNIPGISFRAKVAVQHNAPEALSPEPPGPYTQEYLKTLHGRIAYLETSRGCPFSCSFCLSGANTQPIRFFNTERARAELLLLAGSGAQTVKLVDRTFNCNPRRARELFRFVIKNHCGAIPADVCFHFEVAADLFDASTLKLLAAAPPGLIRLEAGLQTFNAAALRAVRRETDLAKVEKNIRSLLAPGNIHLHIDLIAGLPHEGLESFKDSFDRAYLLLPHVLQLGFLKLLHGSELRNRAKELGYKYDAAAPYEVFSNPWLSESDLQTIKTAERALQKLYNSGRFRCTLEYVLKTSCLRPFALFAAFGERMPPAPLSLNALMQLAYGYFSGLTGVNPPELRDAMACDCIACGVKIPDFLKLPDKNFKASMSAIRSAMPHIRNAALLYSGGPRAVFASGPKSPVTGRHPIGFYSFEKTQ